MIAKALLGPVVASTLLVAGCGDNSKTCGAGTMEVDGTCLATPSCGNGTKLDPGTGLCIPDGSIVCTDGTRFDPTSGTCEVDPAACQDGTVLVDHVCVDPGKPMLVDVEEGPEPNGLGILEASVVQAGTIVTPPAGGPAFVIHGHIDPWRDANGDGQLDPDVDTYVLTVSGPSLLHITSDGLHGIAAGFVAVADAEVGDPLSSWRRFGINISGDTSARQVYLPRAGTYQLAIADTRTLFEYSTGGPINAAPGGPDGEYYVSIDTVDLPSPTALAVTGGTATETGTVDGETVRFFTVPMGTGLNDVVLDMPSAQANASVVIANNGVLRTFADESTSYLGSTPAEAVLGGIDPGDTTLVVVDETYDTALSPVDFSLEITTTSATALSTTGDTVTQPATAKTGEDFTRLDQFYFDVTDADATTGLAIAWSAPVIGQIYDADGVRAAAFSSPFSSATTWQTYRGIVRLRRPGRYYFLVFDPAATVGTTTVGATSTIATLAMGTVAEGTPLDMSLDPSVDAAVARYNAGNTDAWQQFDVTGTGTGGQRVGWFDPAAAYGRLDTLTTSSGTRGPDVAPVFAHTFAEAGGAFGRILLDDPTRTYLVEVRGASPTGTPSATLSFVPRPGVHDLGVVAAGDTGTSTGDVLDSTTPAQLYLFRTDPGNPTTITVHPKAPSLDTRFHRLRNDESGLGPVIDTGNPGNDDTGAFVQPGDGWTAFRVDANATIVNPAALDVTVAPATAMSYGVSPGTTAYADACGPGSTPISFPDPDEGVSSPISAPAGFTFYTIPVPQFVVSTNGFLSFDTTLADPAFLNGALPSATPPVALVAPYWTDLRGVSGCTRWVGGRLVVQWTGRLATGLGNIGVEMQVILDPADQSIELVYGPGHEETGDHATIGIEDPAGVNAQELGFLSHDAIAVPGSYKLTPL